MRLKDSLLDLSHHVTLNEDELFNMDEPGTSKQYVDPAVHSPPHYTNIPGVEAIQVTEHFNFNVGNAIKYLLRHELKGNPEQDLEKALWYIRRELHRRRMVKAMDVKP